MRFGFRSIVAGGWAVALVLQPALAAPPDAVRAEIDYLLTSIERSDCEFYRNGFWFGPERAESHLRQKYDHLVSKDRIRSTEEFIELAATTSSRSGKPYRVRCGGAESVVSSEWLGNLLRAYRSPPQG